MDYTLTALSKNTGALAFIGSTDYGDYIFEISRLSRRMEFGNLSGRASGICHEKYYNGSDYYIISHSTNLISRYSNGVVTSGYQDLSPYSVDEIVLDKSGNIYFFDDSASKIVKFSSAYTFVWELDVEASGNRKLFLSDSNSSLVLKDDGSIFTIKDMGSFGRLLNNIEIDGTGDLLACISGEHETKLGFMKWRQFTGTDLDQSSSSSSSSSDGIGIGNDAIEIDFMVH